MIPVCKKTAGQIQAEAWAAWLDSKDGESCSAGTADGIYLKNRLWWAFMAGYEAAARINRARDQGMAQL